jgi:hypothetical protein
MRTYTLTHPAYGQEAGDQVNLDEKDPLVQLNVNAGILTKPTATDDAKMTCPICVETMKRPPKFEGESDLSEHYADKHVGFVVPAWAADEKGVGDE